ncbi:AfsR/SARP family transcriptional regulator [Amycolatopsis viridis]|uniref:DNA-binding SARP family transcriptional activator n=1 Tax=Amycolatopsis viridis TaxID=185678 RepID=A0ABX0SWF1_9PSEU|nr:BTAD domain-containing putative transcriptional regulator [Amycolatopsis viridis]NIH79685.1 DNA-binding SARP family transcriptional activator [Amycolatopsis viridis]
MPTWSRPQSEPRTGAVAQAGTGYGGPADLDAVPPRPRVAVPVRRSAERTIGARTEHPPVPRPEFAVRLLPSWRLTRNQVDVDVPGPAQRLIALLALNGPHNRSYLAGTLWPERSDAQAYANLRSALSRLATRDLGVIQVSRQMLALAPSVSVDVHDLVQAAESILYGGSDEPPDTGEILRLLHVGDLLCGWYEDWVLTARERLRQLRLHALEAASGRLADAGRYVEALDTAMVCAHIDPLRESAHRSIIRVHLLERNHTEAIRQFRRYRDLLRAELDIEPSPEIRRLLRTVDD